MFAVNFNHPKFIKSKNRILKETPFTEGISSELKEKIALHEANLEILFSKRLEKETKDGCSLIDFAENIALEKLWKEIRNPQKQIAFVEALSNLTFEVAIHGMCGLRKEKAAIQKFIKKMKECAEILEQTQNFKSRVNSGLERMFIPIVFESISEKEKLKNRQQNLIKGSITRITDNLNIVSLANKGSFEKIDYFSLLVFSLLTLVNLEMEKESYVDLKTPKSYRRTAYLKKRTKELLQQAGLTKSIDFRTEEVMEAMGWK